MARLILFNKPYQVLCQFTDGGAATDSPPRKTLAHYISQPGFYAAGRLDFNSEGLLVLTNDGALQARIASPKFKLDKAYWVQVEGRPDASAIEHLQRGIELRDGITKPARVAPLDFAPALWPREPPVAAHRDMAGSWLDITLTEGRNRQIRRMCAAIGHPVLRLVRYRIGSWSLHLSGAAQETASATEDAGGDHAGKTLLAPGEFVLTTVHLPSTTGVSAKSGRRDKVLRKPR